MDKTPLRDDWIRTEHDNGQLYSILSVNVGYTWTTGLIVASVKNKVISRCSAIWHVIHDDLRWNNHHTGGLFYRSNSPSNIKRTG